MAAQSSHRSSPSSRSSLERVGKSDSVTLPVGGSWCRRSTTAWTTCSGCLLATERKRMRQTLHGGDTRRPMARLVFATTALPRHTTASVSPIGIQRHFVQQRSKQFEVDNCRQLLPWIARVQEPRWPNLLFAKSYLKARVSNLFVVALHAIVPAYKLSDTADEHVIRDTPNCMAIFQRWINDYVSDCVDLSNASRERMIRSRTNRGAHMCVAAEQLAEGIWERRSRCVSNAQQFATESVDRRLRALLLTAWRSPRNRKERATGRW